ncbi:MAG: GDSL-type esterase/lipase family protein [Leptolyngbyaceae cyanobacterium bins.59]|nr:GDSL-type esterase/lipase family protein [Leptolyngbyaceae cyanobacterium bins.59]
MQFRKRWLLFNTLVLALFGSSIALNFLLYNQAKKYYFELNETRLDPVGLAYYPVTSQEAIETDRIRVIFFGDSRSANWTPPNMNGYEFINRGISSQTSVQTLQRFTSHVRPLNPDIVIIQVGVNDLKTVALFPERRQTIVTNTKANIKRMVEESRSLGAVVILTTIFPAGEMPLQRKPFWSDAIGQAIQEVNAYIATLTDHKTLVFDAFSILANPQGVMLPKYRADELHLNEQGYEVLNQELVQFIDRARQNKLQK